MAKRSDEPMVTIGRCCPICHKHYVLGHPKDTKPICDECSKALREIIDEHRHGQNEKEVQ